MSTLADTVRRRIARHAALRLAEEHAARGRIREARAILAGLYDRVSAIEVYRSQVHIDYASPVHSRFDVTDTEVES